MLPAPPEFSQQLKTKRTAWGRGGSARRRVMTFKVRSKPWSRPSAGNCTEIAVASALQVCFLLDPNNPSGLGFHQAPYRETPPTLTSEQRHGCERARTQGFPSSDEDGRPPTSRPLRPGAAPRGAPPPPFHPLPGPGCPPSASPLAGWSELIAPWARHHPPRAFAWEP